jgi:hypothetical protein
MAAGFDDFINRSRDLRVNSSIAEKYVLYLKNKENPNERSRLSYCIIILIFLESLDKELESLTLDDFIYYKNQRQKDLSDNRLNDVLSRIADFIEFCFDEGRVLRVRKDAVLNLKVPRGVIKEKNPPRVICHDEIVAIRQTLIGKNDMRRLLTFELLYGFGLKEKDLSQFTFDKYDMNTGSFTGDTREIFLPEYLHLVISKASARDLDRYSTYGGSGTKGYKNHVIVAGELSNIEQKLKISDLTETHRQTSIECSDCGYTYPFEDQYWMLQEKGCDDFKFFFPICVCCVRAKGWS